MKRWTHAAAIILAMCMLLCACSNKPSGENNAVTDTPGTQQNSPTPTNSPNSDIQPTPEQADSEAVPGYVEVQPISLKKQFYNLSEWDGDRLLVHSEYSHVTLWYNDTAAYAELTNALEQSANSIKQNMESEYNDLCSSVRDELWTEENAEAWVSNYDIQVRRADSVVLSLLADSYADYGFIDDLRAMHGVTYDTQTGQKLTLNDVVDVNDVLTDAIAKELNRHQWAGDCDYRNTVAEYFANVPSDGISWTLDYNGVTFYFSDGDLEEPGNGLKTATVTFAEYPELFDTKYKSIPDAYIAELPVDSSFFTDLDGDGNNEELNVTGYYNSDIGSYSQVGIYATADGHYNYEECSAAGFIPYYVKTADGGHYLYLFIKHYDGGPVPMFTLRVYDVSGGKVSSVGEMNAGPGYVPTDIYRVPTDPENFYLDDFDSMAQDMMAYAVGSAGMPDLK